MPKLKPFYENDGFILYKNDNKLVSKIVSEKSVDMIFADPPYFLSDGGITCKSGKMGSVNKGNWDKTIDIKKKIAYNRKWLKECKKVLKDSGTIWISGTFHNIYCVGVALELEGFSILNNITWQKPNPAPNLSCKTFTHSTETIIWAKKAGIKNNKYYFNYELMKKINHNKQMKDVWLIGLPKKNEKQYGKHPTQKPLELMERILLCSTRENDLVLDPFNGSGTTGVASKKLNRRYIGFEIETEFLNITIERVKKLF